MNDKQRQQFEAVLRFAAFSDALTLNEGEKNEVEIRQWDHRESLVFIEGRGPKAQLLEGEGFWPEGEHWNDGTFWCLVVDSSTAPVKVRVNDKIITIARGRGLTCQCCGKLWDDASVQDDIGSRLEELEGLRDAAYGCGDMLAGAEYARLARLLRERDS